jgi:hypothetical protein
VERKKYFEMATTGVEEVSMTARERARLLNLQNTGQEVDFVQRPRSASPVEENISALDKISGFRPKLGQFGAKITGFIDRPKKPNGEASKSRSKETARVVSPINQQPQGATRREFGDERLEEAIEEPSSESTAKLGVRWKLPEIDRQAVGHLILVVTGNGELMTSRLKNNYPSSSEISR